MMPANEKLLDPAASKKRVLRRGGKWPTSAQAGSGEARPAVRPATQSESRLKPHRRKRARILWTKAQAAARSARLLADAGDWDGSANRAYYAAFTAARALLVGVRASLADCKGHGTIVRRFEKHLVQERGFDRIFGRPFFAKLSHARWVADYDGAHVEEMAARAMLGETAKFLAAVAPLLKSVKV